MGLGGGGGGLGLVVSPLVTSTPAPRSFVASGGSALFAAGLSEASEVHLEQHEWHETLGRRGDIKNETHSDVMRALRSYRNSEVPPFVPLHLRPEYTANPVRELMHTPGTPQYRRREAEIAERRARSALSSRGGSASPGGRRHRGPGGGGRRRRRRRRWDQRSRGRGGGGGAAAAAAAAAGARRAGRAASRRSLGLCRQ